MSPEQLCRRSTGQLINFAGTGLLHGRRTAHILRGNRPVAEAANSSSVSREQLGRRGSDSLPFYGNSFVADASDSSPISRKQLCRRSTGQLAYFAGTALSQRQRIAHLFRGNSSVAEAYFAGTALSQMLRAALLFPWNRSVLGVLDSAPISREQVCSKGISEASGKLLISREQLCRRAI